MLSEAKDIVDFRLSCVDFGETFGEPTMRPGSGAPGYCVFGVDRFRDEVPGTVALEPEDCVLPGFGRTH